MAREHVFYTEVSVTSHVWQELIPGTQRYETVYGTTVIEAQDWADVPENGAYRDRTYKITKAYRSTVPHHRGDLVGHSSAPWT